MQTNTHRRLDITEESISEFKDRLVGPVEEIEIEMEMEMERESEGRKGGDTEREREMEMEIDMDDGNTHMGYGHHLT